VTGRVLCGFELAAALQEDCDAVPRNHLTPTRGASFQARIQLASDIGFKDLPDLIAFLNLEFPEAFAQRDSGGVSAIRSNGDFFQVLFSACLRTNRNGWGNVTAFLFALLAFLTPCSYPTSAVP
jgi:hypothetical protein